jgi:site-specific recombinase XerD
MVHIEKLPYSLKFIGIHNKKGEIAIYARLIMKREKTEFSINVIGTAFDWDQSSGTFKTTRPYNNYLNKSIRDAESKIYQSFDNLVRSEVKPTVANIRDVYKGKDNLIKAPRLMTYVDEVIEFKKQLTGEITKGTMNHYTKMRAYLLEFLEHEDLQGMRIDEWSRKHFVQFETFLLTRTNKFLKKPITRATSNKNLSKLKVIFNHALISEIIHIDPSKGFKMERTQSNRVYLTQDEISRIETNDLMGNKSLDKVRNIFIFSVYSGIRFADALNLKRSSIILESDGNYFIDLTQQKTNKPFNRPMFSKAVEIYKKFIELDPKSEYVLPQISNQKTNLYLKEIAKICNIHKNLSHHVARHSFATSVLLDRGCDLKTASYFLGHTSVRSTEVYAKITKNRALEVVKNLDSLM